MFKKYKVLIIILSIVLSLFVLFLGWFVFLRSHILFKVDGSIDESIDVFSEYVPSEISACYGNKFRCSKAVVTIDSNVDTSTLGTYDVIYTAKYKKHSDSIVKKVSVVDKESPVINTEIESLSVCPSASEFDVTYDAVDNYDGDLTASVSKEVVDDSLKLFVSDSSSNVGTKNISIVREDVTSPEISLSGNSNLYVSLNSKYSDPGYSASDNCDGDLTGNVSVSGSVDTTRAGSYTITYSVTDSAGNSSSVSRNVNVYKPNGDGTRVVYLTFDDGPSAYTGELLDTLAKYNVKVTFFVTNRAPNYNHFIKRAYNEGHTIALHTSSHNYAQVYASADAYFNDLNAVNETVKNITGSYSNLLRFPGGSSNTVSRKYSNGIMSYLTKEVENRGYKYFDWNISSGDADGRTHSSSDYANNVISQLGNSSYYIVLQHDVNANSVRAVGTIIEYGLSHGYTFKALTYDSPTVHHKVAN